nr:hypothetical protein [uncultured Sphaerochaeta sp.]
MSKKQHDGKRSPSTERFLEAKRNGTGVAKETICSITESFTVKKLVILQHKYGTVGEVFHIQNILKLYLLMLFDMFFCLI